MCLGRRACKLQLNCLMEVVSDPTFTSLQLVILNCISQDKTSLWCMSTPLTTTLSIIIIIYSSKPRNKNTAPQQGEGIGEGLMAFT